MTFDLVIFDCDGVLVDSEPVANRVFLRALEEIGLRISFEEVCELFVGLPISRCVEIVERRLGRPVPGDFVRRLQERTFERFRSGLQAVSGVRDALDRLDFPVCVASSGELEKMNLTLGLTGLLPRFEGRMFSATEVARGKPHPDLFLHAAATLGAAPAATYRKSADALLPEHFLPLPEPPDPTGPPPFGADAPAVVLSKLHADASFCLHQT